MDIQLKKISVRELADGYEDNQEEGVRAYGGLLDVRPPYQREFIYSDRQRDAVIDTASKNFPLNVMYWSVRDDGTFEVIDGQQRTISLCQYVDGDFSVQYGNFREKRAFHNLQNDEREKLLDYKLMIYLCSGSDSEKLEWFKTINIAGERLTDQELLNAVYHGPWVSDAKRYFSRTNCPAAGIGSDYLSGAVNRQEYLETAIEWIAEDGKIDQYMSKHQRDASANELWLNFNAVISWVKAVFKEVEKEMKGIDWGRLYKKFSSQTYDPVEISKHVKRLYSDPYVKSRKGVFEYVLGGQVEPRLLDVRVFDEATARSVFAIQTEKAVAASTSNCPLCAVGHSANQKKIWAFGEMDADHVSAWSKGGKSIVGNCQMLCVTHNRAKGNR